jgi:hypothetical protein
MVGELKNSLYIFLMAWEKKTKEYFMTHEKYMNIRIQYFKSKVLFECKIICLCVACGV